VPSSGIWHGIVVEINDDELTLDLRHDSHPDVIAEVSISEWNLQDAVIGDVIELDPENHAVRKLDLGQWTREELDDILARAQRQHERLMRCFDE
jgi:uncharacterized protein YciU (UPF0263 family)